MIPLSLLSLKKIIYVHS